MYSPDLVVTRETSNTTCTLVRYFCVGGTTPSTEPASDANLMGKSIPEAKTDSFLSTPGNRLNRRTFDQNHRATYTISQPAVTRKQGV
ncbi:hypothetical protein GE061_012686 [Apolygus lucorum]|uniref:Uncharacterized protein n=1 Tax=Apolygus lucorum TaxID=248454 RepID=A0A6A4JTK9_APOLU|nr:hypothetical protein GE061_012686 [Apolygus lucorum]